MYLNMSVEQKQRLKREEKSKRRITTKKEQLIEQRMKELRKRLKSQERYHITKELLQKPNQGQTEKKNTQ